MQQLYSEPEFEPPSKPNIMKDASLPLILIIASLLGSLIAALILGTTHVIDFNWFVVIIVVIMLAIMGFCIWYTFRTRQKLYEQYNHDRAAYREEWQRFKESWHTYFENERFRWDDFAVNFSNYSGAQATGKG